MSIPIDIKIQFLEFLIRSFSPRLNLTTDQDRENWIKEKVGESFGDHLEALFELYFDSAGSLEEARNERDQLIQLQTSKLILISLNLFYLN